MSSLGVSAYLFEWSSCFQDVYVLVQRRALWSNSEGVSKMQIVNHIYRKYKIQKCDHHVRIRSKSQLAAYYYYRSYMLITQWDRGVEECKEL
jgi:hypothetical protein